MNLQLERIELREIELPLKAPFETSFGRVTRRRILLVRVFARGGMTGYGECVAGENPFYNHETIDTAWLMTTKYIVPLLEATRITSAAQVRDALAPIRENRMAKAGVEAAIWDLEAKLAEQPLVAIPRWHAGRDRLRCVHRPAGFDGGARRTRSAGRLESGYQRIKIKIKPGKDALLVEAVRRQFPDITLSVDANSAYSLVTDCPLFTRLDDFALLMIEQPLAPVTSSITPSCSVPSTPRSVSMNPSSASQTRSTHTSWARVESSISSSVASADTVRRRISRRLRRRMACPCGAAECWKPASDAPTTSPSRRCQASRCPAMSPLPTGIGTRTSSSRQ